jgi:hypothetical protein
MSYELAFHIAINLIAEPLGSLGSGLRAQESPGFSLDLLL